MILVDSNIPVYLVGAHHPHKADAQRLLEKLVSERQRLVTDAEVLQEILDRYTAINRREAISLVIKVTLEVMDDVFHVEKTDALRAAEIAENRRLFTARDAVHIVVMERRGVESIMSFDADFDRWPGLQRIHQL